MQKSPLLQADSRIRRFGQNQMTLRASSGFGGMSDDDPAQNMMQSMMSNAQQNPSMLGGASMRDMSSALGQAKTQANGLLYGLQNGQSSALRDMSSSLGQAKTQAGSLMRSLPTGGALGNQNTQLGGRPSGFMQDGGELQAENGFFSGLRKTLMPSDADRAAHAQYLQDSAPRPTAQAPVDHAQALRSGGGNWGNIAPPEPAAPAPAQRRPNGLSMATNVGLQKLGLKRGGDLRTGMGGAVPGTGSGDKIDAKYEPGEFVVSNDMLEAQPGLRESLRGLRAEVLADKGMTVEQADAKALRYGDEAAQRQHSDRRSGAGKTDKDGAVQAGLEQQRGTRTGLRGELDIEGGLGRGVPADSRNNHSQVPVSLRALDSFESAPKNPFFDTYGTNSRRGMHASGTLEAAADAQKALTAQQAAARAPVYAADAAAKTAAEAQAVRDALNRASPAGAPPVQPAAPTAPVAASAVPEAAAPQTIRSKISSLGQGTKSAYNSVKQIGPSILAGGVGYGAARLAQNIPDPASKPEGTYVPGESEGRIPDQGIRTIPNTNGPRNFFADTDLGRNIKTNLGAIAAIPGLGLGAKALGTQAAGGAFKTGTAVNRGAAVLEGVGSILAGGALAGTGSAPGVHTAQGNTTEATPTNPYPDANPRASAYALRRGDPSWVKDNKDPMSNASIQAANPGGQVIRDGNSYSGGRVSGLVSFTDTDGNALRGGNRGGFAYSEESAQDRMNKMNQLRFMMSPQGIAMEQARRDQRNKDREYDRDVAKDERDVQASETQRSNDMFKDSFTTVNPKTGEKVDDPHAAKIAKDRYRMAHASFEKKYGRAPNDAEIAQIHSDATEHAKAVQLFQSKDALRNNRFWNFAPWNDDPSMSSDVPKDLRRSKVGWWDGMTTGHGTEMGDHKFGDKLLPADTSDKTLNYLERLRVQREQGGE